MRRPDRFFTRVVSGTVGGLLFFGAFVSWYPYAFCALLIIILCSILMCEWSVFVQRDYRLFFLTPVYPILPIVLLIHMYCQPVYYHLLALFFVSLFVHDTGAYLVGSVCGSRRLAPSISPGKTWQGCIGGMVSMYLLLQLSGLIGYIQSTPNILLVIAIVGSTSATLGDLFESYIKRSVGLKDSGNMLPGHGGLLDRFDSILLSAYILYLLKESFVGICG